MRQSLTIMSCLTKRRQFNGEQRRSHQCNAPDDVCGTQTSLKLMTGPFLFCSFFLCCVVDLLLLANTAQASGVACSAMRNTTACSTNITDCQWCPGVGACRPVTETCYTSCHQASAAGSAYCTANTTLCKWCPNIGLCAPTADVCYTSCAASSSEGSSYCSSTTTCAWCPDIGLCRATSGQACFTTCSSATADSSACDLSSSFKWCSVIGVCRANSETCYGSCNLATSDGDALCRSTTQCQWCAYTGICNPNTKPCYSSCAAASGEGNLYCANATTCTWCPAIGLCSAKSGQACFTTCSAATANSSACDLSNSCKWCSVIGVCRTNSETCYSNCMSAVLEPLSTRPSFCASATQCKWCSNIGVCNPNSKECYPSCAAASGDGASYCSSTNACTWCPDIGLCRAASESCYATCTAAAANPSACDLSNSCQWCGALGICRTTSERCYGSCADSSVEVRGAEFCNSTALCWWCSEIGVCQPRNVACYKNCPAANANVQHACAMSSSCTYCPAVGACVSKGVTCYTSCAAATEDQSFCSTTELCAYCSAPPAGGSSIGVCQLKSTPCYRSCNAATVDIGACDDSTLCRWCGETGICELKTTTCKPSCIAATTGGSNYCNTATTCQWCSAIGLCDLKTATCYPSCLTATTSMSSCDISLNCAWCNTIGVCRANADNCYASCPLASLEGTTYCNTTTHCKWCPSSAVIGGYCQSKSSGTCWDTCLAVSNDAAAPFDVCTAVNATCRWCGTLQYCTNKSSSCHTACDTVADDNQAICQVNSIQVRSCSWCSPLTSCFNKSKNLACPATCEALIWQQSACESFSGCHWCPQHGGRCKPVHGKSRGYVDWRGEVECETNTSSYSMSGSTSWMSTETSSATPTATNSLSWTNERGSSSFSQTATLSTSASVAISAPSPSAEFTMTHSMTATTSNTISASLSPSATPTFTTTLSISTTHSESTSHSATFSDTMSTSDSPTPSDTLSTSIDPCNTTFRDNPTHFLRQVTLVNEVQYGTINSSNSLFMVINRVELAALRTLRLQIGFNTYLRNFYYNTSLSWFPLPQVSKCIAGGFELVNATDFIARIDYNPDVSLEVGVNDDYICNMTFSTDIFQCQLMTNFTFNFSAAILVTGTPRIVSATAAQAIGASSAFMALISSGVALIQQSRAENLAELASCQFSLVDDVQFDQAPMQLGFGSALQYYNRGCVVGNVTLIASIAVLFCIILAAVAFLYRGEVALYEGELRQATATTTTAGSPAHHHNKRGGETLLEGVHSVNVVGDSYEWLPTMEHVDTDQLDLELFSDLLTTSTPPALNNEQKEGDVERISTPEVNSDISDDALMKQRSQYGQTPPLFGVLHDKNGAQHDSSTTTTTTTSARSHHGGNTTEKEEFRVEDYFQEVQPFPEDADLSLPADQSSSDIDHRAKKRSSSLFLAMDVDDLFAGMQPAPLASLVSDPSRHHYDHDERKLDEQAVVAIEELNTSNRQSDNNNEDVANNNNASKSKKKTFLQSRPETFQEAFVRHAATIAFPSLLTLPACLLFDSTITFSVRLLVHPVDPNDILIGVVGLLVYGGLLIACIAFTVRVTRSPAPLKVRLTHPLVGSAKLRFLRYLFLPSHHYEPRRRRDRRQQNMMSYVLEEFRIPQFFCCDLALSALIASLAGVGISRRELCTKLAAVALAGHVVFFLAVIWLRPFTVRFAFGLAVAAAGLGVISSLFTLLSMSTGSLVLGTINQYAEIGMLWVSALGSIVTLISIVAYVRNRCAADRKSSGRKAASEEEKPHSVGFDDDEEKEEELIDFGVTSSRHDRLPPLTAAIKTKAEHHRTKRWCRRIVRDMTTGEEADTGSSSSSSDDDDEDGNALKTIVDAEGRTTSDREEIQRRLDAILDEQKRQEAAFSKMALGVLELVGGEEAIERQALERNEAVIFIPIVMLEATERSAVEVVQQNNAVWLEMMEKQRLADVNSDSSQLDDNEQLVSLFKDSNHNNRKGNSEDRHRPPPNLFLPRFALDSNDDEDRNNMSMTTTTPPSYSNSLESDQEVK